MPVVLWGNNGALCASFCSALSQEEQDDAQLKIEDILQMVSITTCCYDNVLNRKELRVNFKHLLT